MNQLGQVTVNYSENHKGLLVEGFVQGLVHLVLGPDVVHAFETDRPVTKLRQRCHNHFFRGFTGRVGKQIDNLGGSRH